MGFLKIAMFMPKICYFFMNNKQLEKDTSAIWICIEYLDDSDAKVFSTSQTNWREEK